VDDIVDSLPASRLYTSTGFYDDYRAGFVLEFESLDTLSGLPVRHRLAGIIYRLPDESQLLFTVWGKASETLYPSVKESMAWIQEGLAYRGAYQPQVFAQVGIAWWPFVLIAVAIAGLIFVHLRRRRRAVEEYRVRVNFWTCECGRLNHNEHETCRRCGRARPIEHSPGD
jgi:hypothetical protein